MNKIFLLSLLTFLTLISKAQDYDSPEGASQITHQNGWTGSYSTIGATNTGPTGACGDGQDRWFKFDASSPFIRVTSTPVKMTSSALVIWEFENNSWTVLDCQNYHVGGTTLTISHDNLQIGNTYYISMAHSQSFNASSFTLEVSTNYDFDYPEGAVQIPHQNGWTGSYSTIGATNTGPAGACGDGQDRWFKFDASSPFIRVTSTPVNMTSSTLVIWEFENNSWTVLDCQSYHVGGTTLTVSHDNLQIGNTYYISMAHSQSNNVSSFSLQIEGGLTSLWTTTSDVLHPINLQSKVSIGIVTIPNDYSLAINGKIISEEVKVALVENWPDFVFDDEYELQTLEEVEKHINENGHLPEILSEEEVTENGINLGEMDAKLLQKIEELTLYMIDMNKRVSQLEQENSELKVNNQELREKVKSLENK